MEGEGGKAYRAGAPLLPQVLVPPTRPAAHGLAFDGGRCETGRPQPSWRGGVICSG